MEANPGTFEQEKFAGYKEAGINRLSIGIQSFNNQHLTTLGRIHDAAAAETAVAVAKQAGFNNINIDLMYALPGQTVEQAVSDVSKACDLGVQHISHYQLTIEPNTYFFKHPPTQADNDTMWQIQTACQQTLADSDYRHYEVSAYSQAGRQSRHNINYWQFGDYIGIGAGAHGKLTDPAHDNIARRWKKRQPLDYIRSQTQGCALSGEQLVERSERCFEFLLNALRLRDGVSPDTFTRHTGLELDELHRACAQIDNRLLSIDKDCIGTTDKGFEFLNEILQQLLP